MGKVKTVIESNELIQELVQIISGNRDIEKIWLYGSRARGDQSNRSDIDLAIESRAISNQNWINLYHTIADYDTLYSLDLVKMDEVSQSLKERILEEGELLYEKI